MKTTTKRTPKKRRQRKKSGIEILASGSPEKFVSFVLCLKILLLAIGAEFVCAPLCLAQMQPPVVSRDTGTTRSIQGSVLNAEGDPIAGAIVLLKDTKTLQVRSYIAQPDGGYHFYGLSTDVNYQVRAQSGALTSKTKTVSVFDSHKTVKLNLKVSKKLKS